MLRYEPTLEELECQKLIDRRLEWIEKHQDAKDTTKAVMMSEVNSLRAILRRLELNNDILMNSIAEDIMERIMAVRKDRLADKFVGILVYYEMMPRWQWREDGLNPVACIGNVKNWPIDMVDMGDGTFVVSHDDNYKRLGGPETKIANMTTEAVLTTRLTSKRHGITYAGTPCTLGEFLDICKQYNVVPVVEVKECTTIHSNTKADNDPVFDGIPAMINLIDQKGLTDKVVIISFMPGVVDFIHRHYPDVTVQVLAGEGDGDIMEWVEWCKHYSMDLDVVHTLVTKEAVDAMHNAGLKVNVWTVDNVEDFERVKAMGVDFITTNARFPKQL